MKATELRIGNLLNYQTAEGDILTTTIDWQDLKWISEDEQSFNLIHSFIPLTEEWLLRFGFKAHTYEDEVFGFVLNDFGYINEYQFRIHNFIDFDAMIIPKAIKTVNQLQNLYFALTGEELSL